VFRELFAIDSNVAPAYLNCGKAFAMLGNKDSAIVCFSRAITIDPSFASALYDLGKMYEVAGDYQKSVHYLLRASHSDPNDPETYFVLGNCCLKSNRREEAITWYEKSISLNSSFIIAHRQLALALDSCGKHDVAQRQTLLADSISSVWKSNIKK
jgi:tetratricopeptide (TPR) repeat protein